MEELSGVQNLDLMGGSSQLKVEALWDVDRARTPFSDESISFLTQLSSRLLRDRSFRSRFPDGAAFGYFVRRSSLLKARNHYESLCVLSGGPRPAIGRVLQFAPANVEIISMYTWAIAVMCGCPTVVRLSSRRSQLTEELLSVIDQVALECCFKKSWRFVDFPREDTDLSNSLAKSTDLLVLWGGDESVLRLRQLPIPATSRVLSFPNRESLAVIDSKKFLALSTVEKKLVSQLVHRDIALFGQNACSSTRSVVWVGSDCSDQAQGALIEFWRKDESLLVEFDLAELSRRRGYLFEVIAKSQGPISFNEAGGFLIIRGLLMRDRKVVHPASGLVTFHTVDTLEHVSKHLVKGDQTLTQFGFEREEIKKWFQSSEYAIPLRVVGIGKSAEFSLMWDGFDLIYEFTRGCCIG